MATSVRVQAAEAAKPLTPFQPATVGVDAQNVQLLGHIGGATQAVYVVNNRAYLGVGPRLIILNVTTPASPTVLGKSLPLQDAVKDVVVLGDIAYIANGSGGLRVFGVQDPTKPQELGFYAPPGGAERLFVANNLAYVVDRNAGLRIINVTNPANPTEVGFFNPTWGVEDVYVVGNIAYLANSFAGLLLLNVTNPAVPTVLGSLDTPGNAKGIFVAGSIAYLADEVGGLRLIDVANPAAPVLRGLYTAPGNVYDVFVVGSTAYVADGKGMRMVNVANPAAPSPLATYYDTSDFASRVFVAGSIAYVTANYSGLRIVDIALASVPREIGVYDSSLRADYLTVVDHTAYLADFYGGLSTMDVTDPANPIEQGFIKTTGQPRNVVVVNQIAYVAAGPLEIINVANPTQLTRLRTYTPTLGFANGVDVIGNLAYLAGEGLEIVDISNPALPVRVSVYTPTLSADDVVVVNKMAYVADYGDSDPKLYLVNVANPANPVLVGVFSGLGYATDLFVANNFAYLLDGNSGLHIVDVTNPANPSERSVFAPTPAGEAWNVYVKDQTAYLANLGGGLALIDVADPTKPTQRGFYNTPGSALGVFVEKNIVYITAGDAGLFMLRDQSCRSLTLTRSGTGDAVTPTPANSPGCPVGQYIPGETINLQAAPATGWRVAGWQGTVNDSAAATTNIIVMPAANLQASVVYLPNCYRLVLAHSGSGSHPQATPANSNNCVAGAYAPGESISLNATASPNWQVRNWIGTLNDNVVSTSNLLTMPAADHQVIVNYVTTCFPLTFQHSGSGSDPVSAPANSPTCPSGQYIAGEKINLYATPATGWRVGQWVGAAVPNTSTDNQLVMPAQPQTIGVTYIAIPTTNAGDAYEEDNTCAQAHVLNADGVDQTHTFHRAGDEDWLQFAGVAQTPYRIEVDIPSGSPADVALEVYVECKGTVVSKFDQSFAPGVRLDMTSTATASVYLRLYNADATLGSAKVGYQVSVRSIAQVKTASNTNQAVILVGGSYGNPERLQKNISAVTEAVYSYFRANGYRGADITYLSNDPNVANRTGSASQAALQTAITEWAKQRLTVGGQLTVYLMDHGDEDKFYLDNAHDQVLTPQQLDRWLSQLESALPELKVTVIIEACHAGSFISGEQSISKGHPGRLVLTSTSDALLAYASAHGAYFSDFLVAGLQQGYSLHTSFKASYGSVRELAALLQEPWLDGNGNGVPNEPADIALATQRQVDAAAQSWAPYIVSVQPPTLVKSRGVLRAVVRDDKQVQRVWAVITPPSYHPPQQSSELVAESLPTLVLTAQGNDNFAAEYPGFDELGVYRIAFYAEDAENLVSLPTLLEVTTGQQLFLPLVSR